MVKGEERETVFEYQSTFDYGPTDINMKYKRANFHSPFSYHSIAMPVEEQTDVTTENLLSVTMRHLITGVLYLITFASFPLSFWVCVKRIHALERIVFTRLGKLQPIRGPGFTLMLPFIDNWTKVDLRPRTFTLLAPQLLTADGGIVEAKADVQYQVCDVIGYVLRLRDQESTLRNLGLLCLQNVISEKDQEDLEKKKELISAGLKDELNRSVLKWGLEVTSINLHSVRVIKEAEPVDAVGTLVNALKSATGSSESKGVSQMPFFAQMMGNIQETGFSKDLQHEKTEDEMSTDIVRSLKHMADDAAKSGLHKDITASISLNITGDPKMHLGIIFNQGEITVQESENGDNDSDVQVTLSEEILYGFLQGVVSPLDAYMQGKVTVKGDWKLLRLLANMVNVQ